ncbi:HD domain-containing protein [Candidatus Riflebacteria bacterium]
MSEVKKFSKVIRSPGFGLMTFSPCVSELIETPEYQRLSSVRQLGPIYLIYPGGNHSRLLHSLEVSYVAEMIGRKLGLNEVEVLYLATAGLLHDLGHGPYSHSTEVLYNEIHNRDHMDYTCDLITGKMRFRISKEEDEIVKAGQIPKILNRYKLDPHLVASLIRREYDEKPYLQDLIFGPVDADQLAFLSTDSRFLGLSYGTMNLDTIAEFFIIKKLSDAKEHLLIHEKAIPAIKDVIMSRLAMYNFYMTDTGLIVGNLLSQAARRAIKAGEMKNFEVFTDDEFRTHLLRSKDSFVREIGIRIKYRNLFKIAYSIPPIFSEKQKELLHFLNSKGDRDADPDLFAENERIIKVLSELGAKKLKEKILQTLPEDMDPDYVMVNLTTIRELNLTEPRLKEARKIKVFRTNGEVVSLAQLAPFFTLYVENENVIPASLYVISHPDYRDQVRSAIKNLIKELL